MSEVGGGRRMGRGRKDGQEEWKGRVEKSKLHWRLEHSSLPSPGDDS